MMHNVYIVKFETLGEEKVVAKNVQEAFMLAAAERIKKDLEYDEGCKIYLDDTE